MRYPKDHKRAARQRLLEQGGHHAKQHGFNESGMAALAAAAGVTTGALYKHFDGKAGLFAALITAELQRTARLFGSIEPADSAEAAGAAGGARALADLLAGYLSLQHVGHPGQGCPLPALTPEVARADETVRAAYQAGLLEVHAQLARLTPNPEVAWALIAQNVGAVMLARALPDESLQRDLLSALRQAGTKLLLGDVNAAHRNGA